MYEQFFGLTAPPFQINPDPSFYYESKGHSSAHQYLRFGAFQGEGFIVVTGDIGAGKTTLLRTLLAELDPAKVVAAQIVSTQLEAGELLSAVALAFGVPTDGMNKAKLLVTLEAYLASLATSDRRALLIIDEAQNLGPAAIEELRMLSNFQFGNKALLQSFLVGQPELREILRLPALEQLRQRVIASCHLGPMQPAETRAYVEHRLGKVGWSGRPAFDDPAFGAIHQWSGGVPRRINMLCSRLLLSAFLDGVDRIDADRVDRVAGEIRTELSGIVEPAPGAPGAAAPSPGAHATITEPTPAGARSQARADAEARFRAALHTPPATAGGYLDLDLAASRTEQAGKIQQKQPGPLLCVASSQDTLVVMSALLHAFGQREDLPPALPLQILEHDANGNAELAARDALDLILPDLSLRIETRAPTPAGRMAEVLSALAPLLDHYQPSAMILGGDDTANVACALMANQSGVPVVRVDAGLRHGDRTVQRETNRVLIDHASSLLCAGERAALARLQTEGVAAGRVHLTGTPLIDALHHALPRCPSAAGVLARLGTSGEVLTQPRGYGLVWMEHALEGDHPKALAELDSALRRIGRTLGLIWPMRPDLHAALPEHRYGSGPQASAICITPALSYLEMLGLLREASCVLTDSGWLQDLATALGIPCLTLAKCSERQASIQSGTNSLVGGNIRRIFRELSEILDSGGKSAHLPELWDGHAAERIAWQLSNWLLARQDREFRAHLEGA